MPKLAAFPKAFMDELCLSGEMTLQQWIELAATLDIDGLEFYAGFLEMKDQNFWPEAKKMATDQGLEIPMMCCSPDFTHPDEAFRKEQIEHEKFWMEMTAALGGKYCRVLSGQRRPEVSREEGIQYTVSSIEACLLFSVMRSGAGPQQDHLVGHQFGAKVLAPVGLFPTPGAQLAFDVDTAALG